MVDLLEGDLELGERAEDWVSKACFRSRLAEVCVFELGRAPRAPAGEVGGHGLAAVFVIRMSMFVKLFLVERSAPASSEYGALRAPFDTPAVFEL
jgi:hypothetical protein